MTIKELHERQSWTLPQKAEHSLEIISTFVERMGGVDKVFVSFSGGKDSTVLWDLCKRIYPNILAVFSNTGNEYPEIIKRINEIIKSGANLLIIRPNTPPREIWTKYGFPLVSKETARHIYQQRCNPNSYSAKRQMNADNKYMLPFRWRYLIDAEYDTSPDCCYFLKKQPMKKFQRQSGRYPIIGTMASESILRAKAYVLRGGCNAFDKGKEASYPLSIWTEDDIWEYIKHANLKIADIYAKGLKRTGCMGCGFGAHIHTNHHFDVLYKTHPKCYNMVMNYTNHRVTFREAIRQQLAVVGRYLPDEEPRTLFSDIECD